MKPTLIIETFEHLNLICLTPVINGIKREWDAFYPRGLTDMQEMIDLFHANPVACIFAYKSRMYAYENEVV